VDAECTRLGASLALGTWALAGDEPFGYGPCPRHVATRTIEAALAAGCRRFDTAAAFADGNVERLLGEVLKGTHAAVTTRVGFARTGGAARPDFSPDGIAVQVAASAERLGTLPIDRVLLYTPSAATLRHGRALAMLLDLKARGSIREVGAGVNEPAEARLAAEAGADWVCVPYNLANRKFERFLSDAPALGVRVQVREALHNGLLTDHPRPAAALSARDLRKTWPADFRDALAEARARVRTALPDLSITAAALGYALGHPNVAEVVVGCRGAAQVEAAFAARPLDPGERERLEAALYLRAEPRRRTSASMASISSSDSP
jgi:aryl-alcohol dehydrogenase-like predicted oxidoreductase